MSNLEIYEKFRNVPESAKKKITGGRLNGFTDINPMWRIKMLTEQFGPVGIGWHYDITDQKLEKGANDEIAAFVKINLFVKHKEDWSKPIQGIGGSMFVNKEKNGMYTSDECFKMALTDAISTSCKALGIGADVYFERDKMDGNKPKPDTKPELVPTMPEWNKAVEYLRGEGTITGIKKRYSLSDFNEQRLKDAAL